MNGKYLKVYKHKWMVDNSIPPKLQPFFISFASLMAVSNPVPTNRQVIRLGGDEMKLMCESTMLSSDIVRKNVLGLVNCGAVRRCGRSMYEINPEYATLGE